MGYYIGVMSGTSMDGIDAALIETSPTTKSKLIAHHSEAFEIGLYDTIQTIIRTQQCQLIELGQLDIQLGLAYANAINHLLKKARLSPSQVVAVGCHGQTLFHCPESDFPFSMQIGNGHVIAEKTALTTVCDFRQRDIANGGQGAPLVPAFHSAMFRSKTEHRVIVNIGGISNISILPASSDKVIGFDTGPGNTLMDAWIQHHLQQPFDNKGDWASKGRLNESLFRALMSDPYLAQNVPKSTGREMFNLDWLTRQLIFSGCENIPAEDVQATLMAFTVACIADSIHQYATHFDKIYICGGGSKNTALMKQLQLALAPVPISTTLEIGLDPQWVESAAFGWLAEQALLGQAIDLRTVTGAKKPNILGAVYLSKNAS